MRILVISDCHTDKYNLFEAIKREPTAEVVIFTGDGFRNYEEARETFGEKKAFFAVSGNCDLGYSFPDTIIRVFEGKKFYITHGHNEHVKFELEELLRKGKENNCDVILFGHTHEPLSIYRDGIYIFNSGALKNGSYGVVDITDKGIICINKSLVY